jgi:SNF2 family DNA or RNA helicase
MKKEVVFKVRSGGYKHKVPGSLTDLGDGRTKVSFRYNKTLIDEIKSFEGARWHPDPDKWWSIKNSQRNDFQLEYLLGGDPYAYYDKPLIEFTPRLPLRKHQIDLTSHMITYRQVITAAEMGVGKSASAIEAIEFAYKLFQQLHPSEHFEVWWVAPKSALRSTELELEKWKCKVKVVLHTYESLKKAISNWPKGKKAPFIVIFDEASRLKTPTAQRSVAAQELADGVRSDWGNEGFVILMTGTPAPKSPADWWKLCEIAKPGFIKEGNAEKFKKRLGLIVEKESIQGGVYPHLVTWLDDENKCKKCGLFQTEPCHDGELGIMGGDFHPFEKSVNEVALLYQRMKGLVTVLFKKDCLDLPDKIYEIIRLKPSQSTLRSAAIINSRSTTVIQAMTFLRELSDGFQYEEEEAGTAVCSVCKGKGTIFIHTMMGDVEIEISEDNIEEYRDADANIAIGDTFMIPRSIVEENHNDTEETSCPNCGGSGETVVYKRTAVEVPCPKIAATKELLDRYDDVGRTVWFAGFSGSIDRIVKTCLDAKWEVIRVDGRGWWSSIDGLKKPTDMLKLFQEGTSDKHPRVAFIGQPSAAGLGLTLTASPMICYFSNDFNAESRIQSEDRIHRIGMDENRGATIIDLIHLPTDEFVLNNLKKKRVLMNMTMGEIGEIMKNATLESERKY